MKLLNDYGIIEDVTCGRCNNFVAFLDTDGNNTGDDSGICCCRPPVYDPETSNGVFPTVHPCQCCAEWTKKIVKVNDPDID